MIWFEGRGYKIEICICGLFIGNVFLWGLSCFFLLWILCIWLFILLCIGLFVWIFLKLCRVDWNILYKRFLWYFIKLKIINKLINIIIIIFDLLCFENKKYMYWKINGRICSYLIDIGKWVGMVLGFNVLM